MLRSNAIKTKMPLKYRYGKNIVPPVADERETQDNELFRTRWPVSEAYRIINDRLCPCGPPVRGYDPLIHPEIPGHLAKLRHGDTEAVLKFAQAYGMLGYRAYIPPERWARGGVIPIGDPLEWIWVHAATLRICLELGHRLKNGKLTAIRKYLQQLHVTPQDREKYGFGEQGEETKTVWPAALIAVQGDFAIEEWGWLGQHAIGHHDDVKALARMACRSLINQNIAGIGWQLYDEGERDRLYLRFKALIEIAYWHVAQNVDRMRLKRCQAPDCRAIFVQKDRRQCFCAAMGGPKRESPCAIRYRVQRLHKRKERHKRADRRAASPDIHGVLAKAGRHC
jgi:hypothetical protein